MIFMHIVDFVMLIFNVAVLESPRFYSMEKKFLNSLYYLL